MPSPFQIQGHYFKENARNLFIKTVCISFSLRYCNVKTNGVVVVFIAQDATKSGNLNTHMHTLGLIKSG